MTVLWLIGACNPMVCPMHVVRHKARCSVSAVAAFAKAREAATPAARQAHMARLAVLEKDAADAAQGLTTLWAFADRISSIGHRISSRYGSFDIALGPFCTGGSLSSSVPPLSLLKLDANPTRAA